MKSRVLFAVAMCVAMIAGTALAQDSGGSLPDGPVASPPGWTCTASGGKVTCVRDKRQQQ